MIIRVLAGLVVAPIAGLAALYGASMVFEAPVSEPVSEPIPVTEPHEPASSERDEPDYLQDDHDYIEGGSSLYADEVDMTLLIQVFEATPPGELALIGGFDADYVDGPAYAERLRQIQAAPSRPETLSPGESYESASVDCVHGETFIECRLEIHTEFLESDGDQSLLGESSEIYEFSLADSDDDMVFFTGPGIRVMYAG